MDSGETPPSSLIGALLEQIASVRSFLRLFGAHAKQNRRFAVCHATDHIIIIMSYYKIGMSWCLPFH